MKAEMKHFEDFMAREQRDIFQKVNDLYAELKTDKDLQRYVDALGVQMLGAAQNHCLVQEYDGNVHEVIMLGSNSYFSLTTHPDVVSAAKTACDPIWLWHGSRLFIRRNKRFAPSIGKADCGILPH